MRDDDRTVIAGLRLVWREIPWPDHPRAQHAEVAAASAEAGPAFGLWVLDDPDAMLDTLTQEEFERTDERMPYFAMVWASAESQAAEVLAGPRLDGLHVLDLGCGLGLCGFAAARQGARVTFFDWEPRALEIVAASAERQPLTARLPLPRVGEGEPDRGGLGVDLDRAGTPDTGGLGLDLDRAGTPDTGGLGVDLDRADTRKPAPTGDPGVGAGFQLPSQASPNPNLPISPHQPAAASPDPNLPPCPPLSHGRQRGPGGEGTSPGRFQFVVGDWRSPPPLGPFDLILGADVLYERRNGPAVATFLAGHLKPDAEAWIADPGRPQAGPFPMLVADAGLDLIGQEILPPRAHATEITRLRLRLRR